MNSDLKRLTPIQRGIGTTVRQIDISLSGEQLREHVVEVLAAEHLFKEDAHRFTALYHHL